MKADNRIEAIDLDGGVQIVMLRPGYSCQDAGTSGAVHTFGADTDAEIRRTMRGVKPCGCPDCLEALAGSGKFWS